MSSSRRSGRPPSWSGSYGLRQEMAARARGDQPCPAGCGHTRNDHVGRPRDLLAWRVDDGCGQTHTAGAGNCDPCVDALRRGSAPVFADIPNPDYEGPAFFYCRADGCGCRVEVSL